MLNSGNELRKPRIKKETTNGGSLSLVERRPTELRIISEESQRPRREAMNIKKLINTGIK
jgi:hypothetical protein